MNSIERIIDLKKLVKSNKIDKLKALKQLSIIINSNKVKESDVYLSELHRIQNFKNKKLELLRNSNSYNENSNDIIEFLSLKDEDISKIKNIGYNLI